MTDLHLSQPTRLQRHRQRRREGLAVVPVEIDEITVTDFLVASRFLKSTEADDRQAVSRALSDLVDKIAKEKF